MTLNLTKGNLLMSFISRIVIITTVFMSNLPPEKGVMAKHDVMTCCNNIQVDFKYLIGSMTAN